MLCQALCIISKPSVNSNLSYSPETPNLGQNRLFFALCDLEIWRMTLKNNMAPLLCYFKLCASFQSHRCIQTRVTVRKPPNWSNICFDLCDLDLWPLTLTFCMDITFVNVNNSCKFHDDTMTETLWNRCHRQTDRQTERSVLRAAWSQLKILALDHSSTAEST